MNLSYIYPALGLKTTQCGPYLSEIGLNASVRRRSWTHAGVPQHAGVSRLDGAERGLRPAETARAALGLGLHVAGGWIHGRRRIGAALPKPCAGDQEEPERQRTASAAASAAGLRRHQCPSLKVTERSGNTDTHPTQPADRRFTVASVEYTSSNQTSAVFVRVRNKQLRFWKSLLIPTAAFIWSWHIIAISNNYAQKHPLVVVVFLYWVSPLNRMVKGYEIWHTDWRQY